MTYPTAYLATKFDDGKKKQRRTEAARLNTPAKKTIRRARVWLDAAKNRELVVEWRWVKRNRAGVWVAYENGSRLAFEAYSSGRGSLPNPDLESLNSGSARHQALERLLDKLEELDLQSEITQTVV